MTARKRLSDPDYEIDFTADGIDTRLGFLEDEQIFDIDLSHVHFHDTKDVNAFYDRCEERIDGTGEPYWFFLVNYQGCRIDPKAWFAFSRRGKTLNLAHSMGSVRYDASPETRRQIKRSAGTEAFDPNLFASRGEAIARIAEMPSKRRQKIVHEPTITSKEAGARIAFDHDAGIMEVNFRDLVFHHSADVDVVYDEIERLILETDRKWYFLVDYNGTRIEPEAWVQYARRGKRLNIGASLGSVRFAAGSETEREIRLRAESQDFRPNIRNTREEALERLEEIKAEAGT